MTKKARRIKSKKICSTKFCRKEAKRGTTCYSCKAAKYKERNPFRYAYNTLKQNAKRRKKFFDLTFEQFKSFAIKVDYIGRKGRKYTSLHIDRIDESRGYTANNIQALTNAQNGRKFRRWKSGEWNELTREMEFITVTTEEVEPNFDDCPF